MGKRILFVHGIPYNTRARDLAYEFERYGPIERCDVFPSRDRRSDYGFVQYQDYRDAKDAYERIHGKPFMGGTIRVEWAKRGPESRDRARSSRGRSRSPSPVRAEIDRRRSRSRSASRSRSPSRSPAAARSRSRSPSSPVRSPAADRSRSPLRQPEPASSPEHNY